MQKFEFRPGDFYIYGNVSNTNSLFVRSNEGRWWRIFDAEVDQMEVFDDDIFKALTEHATYDAMLVRAGRNINAEVQDSQ
jgi:hypothetical protein